MSWILNKKDIEWLKGVFGIKPKPQPQPEPVKEITSIPYDILVVKARIQESEIQRMAIVDPNVGEAYIKNQLTLDIMQQVATSSIIEYSSFEDPQFGFGRVIEAKLMVAVKK